MRHAQSLFFGSLIALLLSFGACASTSLSVDRLEVGSVARWRDFTDFDNQVMLLARNDRVREAGTVYIHKGVQILRYLFRPTGEYFASVSISCYRQRVLETGGEGEAFVVGKDVTASIVLDTDEEGARLFCDNEEVLHARFTGKSAGRFASYNETAGLAILKAEGSKSTSAAHGGAVGLYFRGHYISNRTGKPIPADVIGTFEEPVEKIDLP